MNKSGIGILLSGMEKAERPIIKCAACQLRQFIAQSGKCRRCGLELVKVAESWRDKKTLKESDWRSLPSSWLPILFIMLRFRQGLSMLEISRRLNLPRQNITRLEHAQVNLDIERIPKIAAAYGTTPEHLMRMVEYLITGL